MDIFQLSYFIEAAQTKSFRKVSQRYFVSQPSISNSIGNLEAELGAKLFIRTSQGVSLTAEGRELLPYAIQVVENLKTAKSRIRDVHSSNKGTICVASVPGANNVLAECLKASIAQYPEIYVDIKILNGNGQLSAMEEDRYDLTFGGFPKRPNSGKSEIHLIRQGFLSLVLPRSQYSEDWEVNFSELKDVSFLVISPSAGSALYEQIITCCKNRGLIPRIVGFYNNANALLMGVSAGVGISLVPPCMILKGMEEDILEIPLTNEDAAHDYYVSFRKDSSNTAARNFLSVVKTMFRDGK
jgi:DNA-binding transcriptional LysR family regulator